MVTHSSLRASWLSSLLQWTSERLAATKRPRLAVSSPDAATKATAPWPLSPWRQPRGRERAGSHKGRAGGGLGAGSPKAPPTPAWRPAVSCHWPPQKPGLAGRGRGWNDVCPCCLIYIFISAFCGFVLLMSLLPWPCRLLALRSQRMPVSPCCRLRKQRQPHPRKGTGACKLACLGQGQGGLWCPGAPCVWGEELVH